MGQWCSGCASMTENHEEEGSSPLDPQYKFQKSWFNIKPRNNKCNAQNRPNKDLVTLERGRKSESKSLQVTLCVTTDKSGDVVF